MCGIAARMEFFGGTRPAEMMKELEQDTAVLQFTVVGQRTWLLVLTHRGTIAQKLGVRTSALPELLPLQEPTLGQLVEAWKTRPGQIGLDGLIRLARTRAEDLGRLPHGQHNLISAEQERAIQERLSDVALPASLVARLRRRNIRHLLILCDGALHYLPFALLRPASGTDGVTRKYLIEEFTISYAPSMVTLDTIRKQSKIRAAKRRRPRSDLLAFANPAYSPETAPTLPTTSRVSDDMVTRLRSFQTDYYSGSGLRLTSLPETEQEAVRVASLFAPPKLYRAPVADPEGRSLIFLQRAASENTVKRLLGPHSTQDTTHTARSSWRYILFSTHGMSDTRNGLLSCLALASPTQESEQDGYLQAQEILNFDLDADLVMLSACETGLGRFSSGEGLVGMSASFFIAGAESVCASLWRVPSGPTGQLTTEFFRRLKEGNISKAKALQQAQLTVMRQGRSPDGEFADYSSPFCWAAFVLMGEHRSRSD